MNKILTISIAAYNVEKYIEKALNSLLIDNIDDVEILVEDDGGTDNTANIVKEYEDKYPGIVKLVHKENGGYGSTINKSIELAQGKYFKQLDGDDWFDSENFREFIKVLRENDADIFYTPYNQFNEGTNEVSKIDIIPNEVSNLKELDSILKYFSGLMYTLTYRTKILKDNKISITENCFYTDTEYAMYPIFYSSNIYIMHIPLYMYRIGREGQSVSIDGRIKHHNDHVLISNNLIDFFNKNKEIMSKEKYEFYNRFIIKHTTASLTNFLMLLKPNKQNREKIINYENNIKQKNSEIFEKMTKDRKIVLLLRKSKYKLYKPLAYIQKIRFKRNK